MIHSAFKAILVGNDGTPEAERAVEVAISLAQSLRAKLIVLRVVDRQAPSLRRKVMDWRRLRRARERLKERLHRKIQASAHLESK